MKLLIGILASCLTILSFLTITSRFNISFKPVRTLGVNNSVANNPLTTSCSSEQKLNLKIKILTAFRENGPEEYIYTLIDNPCMPKDISNSLKEFRDIIFPCMKSNGEKRDQFYKEQPRCIGDAPCGSDFEKSLPKCSGSYDNFKNTINKFLKSNL